MIRFQRRGGESISIPAATRDGSLAGLAFEWESKGFWDFESLSRVWDSSWRAKPQEWCGAGQGWRVAFTGKAGCSLMPRLSKGRRTKGVNTAATRPINEAFLNHPTSPSTGTTRLKKGGRKKGRRAPWAGGCLSFPLHGSDARRAERFRP